MSPHTLYKCDFVLVYVVEIEIGVVRELCFFFIIQQVLDVFSRVPKVEGLCLNKASLVALPWTASKYLHLALIRKRRYFRCCPRLCAPIFIVNHHFGGYDCEDYLFTPSLKISPSNSIPEHEKCFKILLSFLLH